MEKPIISIKKLNLSLNGTQILSDINCEIPLGQITVILGPSGAGKSSLLKCINHLYIFDGTIQYNENQISTSSIKKIRKDLAYVPQKPVVFPGSVSDNIIWGRREWGINYNEKIVKQFLKQVNLEDIDIAKSATALSVGQQQRLHLARALAVEPKVLLLDEPASALDAISNAAFENLIHTLKKENPNLSIVMITHDLQQAERMAEYAILIDKGKKLLEDNAEVFFKKVKDLGTQAEMLEELLKPKEREL